VCCDKVTGIGFGVEKDMVMDVLQKCFAYKVIIMKLSSQLIVMRLQKLSYGKGYDIF
jgi:hypothetical protein